MTRTPGEENGEYVTLNPFEEIRGRLRIVSSDDQYTYIGLTSGMLRFDLRSTAAQTCLEALDGCIGDQVSILQVGRRDVRIVVHEDEGTDHHGFSSDFAIG